MASNNFTFGAYLGYPTSSAYQTGLSAWTTMAGQAPASIDTYVDYTKPVSEWVWNTVGSATALASKMGTSILPVLGLPLGSTVSDGLTALQRFNAIASGAYDSVYKGIVQAYQAKGFTSLDLRIGWEMNGSWYPWSVKTPADAQGFVSAFQHIADLVHSMPGITVKTVWNPMLEYSPISTVSTYAGDKYVDIVGTDLYAKLYPLNYYDWSTGKIDSSFAQWYANPANMKHYWDYPDADQYFPTGRGAGWGMVEALNFAKTHGKAFALPEVGMSDYTSPGTGPADNPTFPAYLADRLLSAESAGTKVAFVNAWDSGNFTFTDGTRPRTAAAWADFVRRMNAGAGSTTTTAGATTSAGLTVSAYTTLTKGDGNYAVTGATSSINRGTVALGNGTSSVTVTGWADVVTTGNGNETVTLTGNNMAIATGNGAETIVLNGGFGTIAIGNTPNGGTSTIRLGGPRNTVTAGIGNVVIDGATASGSTTVTLGNGNDTVTLGGSSNTVTVGTGASTLTVGSTATYGSVVKAGGSASSGGSVTVNIAGRGNTVDVGAGTTFINAASGSGGDVFVMNASGQGLTTITGFTLGNATLDLTRTLAGTGIGTDLTRIGKYITAAKVNGGADTLLSVDPTGGSGTPYGFALLKGVAASGTMISDMLAKKDFALH